MADTTERVPSPGGLTLLSDAPLSRAGRDYFGFGVYADALAALIDNEITDTPLTIAVTAPRGGGRRR